MKQVDRISDLPDSILCHILSFLPTVQTVRTSSVSKRWRHLWRFVPALRFTDADAQGRKFKSTSLFLLIRSFVYSVLVSRDPPLQIHTLCLTSSKPDLFGFFTLSKWLTVVQRKVQFLQILFTGDFDPDLILPHAILSCETLVVLKLQGFCFSDKSFFSVRLPALKVLHLTEIRFPHTRTLMQLLAGSPKLQDLVLDQRNLTLMKQLPQNWAAPELVPECILLHLRICTLVLFGGLQYELQLARYILENAKVLRSMKIKSNDEVGEGELQRMKENLSSCPRSSATCQLTFC